MLRDVDKPAVPGKALLWFTQVGHACLPPQHGKHRAMQAAPFFPRDVNVDRNANTSGGMLYLFCRPRHLLLRCGTAANGINVDGMRWSGGSHTHKLPGTTDGLQRQIYWKVKTMLPSTDCDVWRSLTPAVYAVSVNYTVKLVGHSKDSAYL